MAGYLNVNVMVGAALRDWIAEEVQMRMEVGWLARPSQ